MIEFTIIVLNYRLFINLNRLGLTFSLMIRFKVIMLLVSGPISLSLIIQKNVPNCDASIV